MDIKTGAIQAYWDIHNLQAKKDIDEIAKEFETIFARMIIKEFRKTIPEGLFNNSFSSKMYLDMLDMQLSEEIAKNDGLGLKNYIKNALQTYTFYQKDNK